MSAILARLLAVGDVIAAKVRNEPVVVTTFAGAVISLLIAFGVDISVDQKTAILLALTAGLAIFARSQVSPA